MGVMSTGLSNNKTVMNATFDNVPAGTTGWIDCSGLAAPLSVTIEGAAAGDAIEVRVSNSTTAPSVNTLGVLYGAAVTASGVVKITEPYRWIRINRTTVGGTPAVVNAWLAAARCPSS